MCDKNKMEQALQIIIPLIVSLVDYWLFSVKRQVDGIFRNALTNIFPLIFPSLRCIFYFFNRTTLDDAAWQVFERLDQKWFDLEYSIPIFQSDFRPFSCIVYHEVNNRSSILFLSQEGTFLESILRKSIEGRVSTRLIPFLASVINCFSIIGSYRFALQKPLRNIPPNHPKSFVVARFVHI